MGNKLYLIIVIFLLINAFFIVSENNLKLNDSENIKIFFQSYFSWFKNIGNNLGEISGNVVNLDWVPNNASE